MSLKKIALIGSILAGFYGLGAIIYFSMAPLDRNHSKVFSKSAFSPKLQAAFFKDSDFNIGGIGQLEVNDHLLGKFINDVSQLNMTRVYDIVTIKTFDDLVNAHAFARDKGLKISIAGVCHSMGGQAFFDHALVLDMTKWNKIISLDKENKILKVQSGATWHDIQLFLHPHNLAVKAMQSTDIFTVGGSLAVNAHGMDHMVGSIAQTIKSFSIMLANGTIETVTLQSNPELFNAVIGGYGLFGIVLEVELEVTDNVMYQCQSFNIDYTALPVLFEKIVKNDEYGLFYAHPSTSPLSFLKDVLVYGYKPIEYVGKIPELGSVPFVKFRRYLLNLAKYRTYGRAVKWAIQNAELIIFFGRSKPQSRNAVMHDSVEYTKSVMINQTDILQEYFIPRQNFVGFIDALAAILQKSKLTLLNISIRAVHQEHILLNYAPQDMFAVVLYLNVKVNQKAIDHLEEVTQRIINAALLQQGTFFLPYQLYYTREQLKAAYPMIDQFFALKKKYDPGLLFMNKFYAKYAD